MDGKNPAASPPQVHIKESLDNGPEPSARTPLDNGVLALPRYASSPFFYLSVDGMSFNDAWNPFLGGLFRAPLPVFYKALYQPAEILLAFRGNTGLCGAPCLPRAIQQVMDQTPMESFEFFWMITDVSSVIDVKDRANAVVNISHHSWYFPDEIFPEVMGGRRVEVPLEVGVFTFGGSQISPLPKACMPFQVIQQMPMTIHPQKGRNRDFGGLCCSPNNGRFCIMSEEGAALPLAHFWSVAITRSSDGLPRKAAVCLHWVVHQRYAPVENFIKTCGSIGEVLEGFGKVLGDQACLLAARGMFGLGGAEGFALGYGQKTETPPIPHEPRPVSDSSRGRGRRGRGRGDRGRRGPYQPRRAEEGEGGVAEEDDNRKQPAANSRYLSSSR